MRRQIVKDSLIIISITFLLLVFIEVALRLAFPGKEKEVPSPYRNDVPYLFSIKPGIRSSFKRSSINGGQDIYWETNSDGFRGPELSEAPDVRIIIYGDSNIQARFSEYTNTFPAQLGQQLRKLTSKSVEVINAGIIGFGPDQSLLRFASEIHRYQPDLVIFSIFADNDFVDLLQNALFVVNESGELDPSVAEVLQNQHRKSWQNRLKDYTSDWWYSLLTVKAARKIKTSLTQTKEHELSASTEFDYDSFDVQSQFDRILERSATDYSNYLEGERSYVHDHYDVDIALFPERISSRVKKTLMRSVLRTAKSIADQANIEFLVVIEPSSRDMTENLPLNHKFLVKYPDYLPTNLSSSVEEICIDTSIPHVNLFGPFSISKPETLYFRNNDDHWNDAGQALAAGVVADYLYSNSRIFR